MWHNYWFDENYLKLYPYRNEQEAEYQVNFLIKNLSLTPEDHILDLACGTGRHALAFAQKGYKVLGVDSSHFLLEKAKEKKEKFSDLHLEFCYADMRNLKHLGVFDLVISMFTSFGYFESDDENAQVFKQVRNCLKPQKKFFLDYLHPVDVIKNLISTEEKLVEGHKIYISRRIQNDQIIKTIQFPNNTYQEKVKLYTRQQIEVMLKQAKFEIQNVWNDYEGNSWKSEGSRQLFYAIAIR